MDATFTTCPRNPTADFIFDHCIRPFSIPASAERFFSLSLLLIVLCVSACPVFPEIVRADEKKGVEPAQILLVVREAKLRDDAGKESALQPGDGLILGKRGESEHEVVHSRTGRVGRVDAVTCIRAEAGPDYYSNEIRNRPNDADLYHLRAMSFRSLGEVNLALRDSQKAIHLEPKNSTYYIERAITWQCANKHREAADELEHALRYDPNNVRALRTLSQARMGLDQHEVGLHSAKRCVELAPKNLEVLIEAAWVHAGTENFDSALSLMDMAQKADPSSYAPLIERAMMYCKYPSAEWHNTAEAARLAERAYAASGQLDWNCAKEAAIAYACNRDEANAQRLARIAVSQAPLWEKGHVEFELKEAGITILNRASP